MKRADDVVAQDLDGAIYAGPASCAETPRVRATHKHRARAEAHCFDDVAAAPDAAVHQNLDASVDRGDHLGQRAQACRNAVELAAAVIRYDHRVGPRINRTPRIVAGVYALHDDWAFPR